MKKQKRFLLQEQCNAYEEKTKKLKEENLTLSNQLIDHAKKSEDKNHEISILKKMNESVEVQKSNLLMQLEKSTQIALGKDQKIAILLSQIGKSSAFLFIDLKIERQIAEFWAIYR